ncbi:MAG: tryptophan synthase subunit alpha [bacterium]
MPTAIVTRFAQLKNSSALALMTHVICGYPQRNSTEALVKTMEEAGADFVELQIPFSDPSADGPTMMNANTEALNNNITVNDCFIMARNLSKTVKIPLIFMTYINILFNYGIEKFVKDAAKAGISGLIVPDFPVEETKEYVKYCRANNIDPIFVISPNTSDKRLEIIAPLASGCLYCTTRTGITGVQTTIPTDVINYLKKVQKKIKLPIAVGFGIAKPEHVKALQGHADCAVVGSAVIELIKKTPAEKQLATVKSYIKSLKSASNLV